MTRGIAFKFILILITIILPIIINDPYWRDVFIFMLIFIIFTTSLRIVFSTGQISFAHPGLAAIGAYCSGTLSLKLGLSFWLSLPLSALASAFASLIIGYPTLRIRGVYFFLITFMFTSLISVAIGNFWISTFGGWKGLINIPRPDVIKISGLLNINFNSDLPFYYLTLFFTIIVTFVLYRMEKSQIGLIFNAIENSDRLSESIGINIMKYKLMAFVISGVFAGIGGSLFAHYQRIITPYDFDLHLGILLFIYIVVGGMDTIAGPILGSLFLRLLAHPLRQLGQYETMILGLILILFLLFIPGGLISLRKKFSTPIKLQKY
jgi:branched-chain amino acid transport system permease protein